MTLQELQQYGIQLRKSANGQILYGAPAAGPNAAVMGFLSPQALTSQGIDVETIQGFAAGEEGAFGESYGSRSGGPGDINTLIARMKSGQAYVSDMSKQEEAARQANLYGA